MKIIWKTGFIFLLILPLLFLIPFLQEENSLHASTASSPAGTTGSPGDNNLTCASACHSGAPVQFLNGIISSNIPLSGYVPGNTYTVTATFNRPGHTKMGFEISPQLVNGNQVGTLVASPGTVLVGSGKYISHNSSGTNAPGGNITWTFQWIAPSTGMGSFSFYGAFNASNSQNNASGDSIFTTSIMVNEDVSVSINEISNESYHVYPNPASDFLNIARNAEKHHPDFEIIIYDITSKIWLKRTINSTSNPAGQFTLSLKELTLPNGIYWIVIKNENEIRSAKKIVIQS